MGGGGGAAAARLSLLKCCLGRSDLSLRCGDEVGLGQDDRCSRRALLFGKCGLTAKHERKGDAGEEGKSSGFHRLSFNRINGIEGPTLGPANWFRARGDGTFAAAARFH